MWVLIVCLTLPAVQWDTPELHYSFHEFTTLKRCQDAKALIDAKKNKRVEAVCVEK